MFEFFSDKLNNLYSGLKNTAQALVGNVVEEIDEEEMADILLDNMEDSLIGADIGVTYASELTDKLRNKSEKLRKSYVRDFLKQEFTKTMETLPPPVLNYKDAELNIYFITGVNGAGKTTLIGKMAYRFKSSGKKVLIAAADTFRAAAEEQLDIWSKRAGADIVRRDGADSGAVVYEAIQKAKNENYDVLLIDTAGRLQNKYNLMEELKKIKNVIDKNAKDNLREIMLVIDANTGQNGLQQSKVFNEGISISSIALTKLDGSAKGGIILAIAKELQIPVKLVGLGEKMEDVAEFDPKKFIDALFKE
ncbi:signal recognition particle-docking protein FtsY [bacterium]|nr:signal recognition particle-docking protein FtsY [bacterium]